MKHGWWMVLALFSVPMASAQRLEKVQPIETGRNRTLFKPTWFAREVAAAAGDFAASRDPVWTAVTLAQIDAASADAATSLNNLRNCPSCTETGVSRLLIGRRPDAHKYLIGGAVEIGVEAVAAHYFRSHGPARQWYWRALWALPQSFSLYEHARAAHHNARLNLGCVPSAPNCR